MPFKHFMFKNLQGAYGNKNPEKNIDSKKFTIGEFFVKIKLY